MAIWHETRLRITCIANTGEHLKIRSTTHAHAQYLLTDTRTEIPKARRGEKGTSISSSIQLVLLAVRKMLLQAAPSPLVWPASVCTSKFCPVPRCKSVRRGTKGRVSGGRPRRAERKGASTRQRRRGRRRRGGRQGRASAGRRWRRPPMGRCRRPARRRP
jgi:hypothetical protein